MYGTLPPTYTRDGVTLRSNFIDTRGYKSYSAIIYGISNGGINCVYGYDWLGDLNWGIATNIY